MTPWSRNRLKIVKYQAGGVLKAEPRKAQLLFILILNYEGN